MPTPRPRSNRGPAAAAANRRAILVAARRVLTQDGIHAPLSAVAKAAGVGQGVLYRHFPSRLDLAIAVFEENFAELEQIAAEPDDAAFVRLWARLVEHTVAEVGFIGLVVEARRTLPDDVGHTRVLAMVERCLPRAARAGLVAPGLSPQDVLLGLRMVYGAVVTADPDQVAASRDRALALLPGFPGRPVG